MAVERAGAGSSLIDVLDRVLDKGIVIDAYVRVSLVGIDLVSVEARIVVASVETYLKFAEAIGMSSFAARPAIGPGAPNLEMDRLIAENVELKRQLAERRQADETR
jgi:gas vesicle structural protein